eukprot:s1082_g12.t1
MELRAGHFGVDARQRLGRDDILHLLLRTPQAPPAPGAGGHLLSMLRQPKINNTPNVAVPQGRSGSGDIHHSTTTTARRGHIDEKPSSVETAPNFRSRLLPDIRLECPGQGEPQFEEFLDKGLVTKDDMPEASKPSFPPTPPKILPSPSEPLGGPWWRSLVSSPVKRLKWGRWQYSRDTGDHPQDFKLPPMLEPITHRAPQRQEGLTPQRHEGKKRKAENPTRPDLPKKKSVLNLPKPNLRNAVKLAMSKKSAGETVKRMEKDFYSNSSRTAKASRRKTVTDVLTAGKSPMPLTPESMKLLGGTLRESGYKSAYMYLAEAKTLHVELGFGWSPLLERNYKLCMAAAKRGLGPKKKAIEVPESQWSNFALLSSTPRQGHKVGLATHLFACGVHWMMREIELANLTATDVRFEPNSRSVTIVWRESKTDSAGEGIARTMQCICEESCDLRCPYAVLEVLVNNAGLKGAKGGHLATYSNGLVAKKADIVADWRKLHGSRVTGQSTRRSGALQYIRKGWSVTQVGYLGRWKSNVIMQYAQEALESMAVNASSSFTPPPTAASDSASSASLANMLRLSTQVDNKADKSLTQKLKEELESLKTDSKGANEALAEAIQGLESKLSTSSKYLPPLVKSGRHQVIHLNCKTLVFSPSTTWKTTCGWYYYLANYQFVEGDSTKVSCAKCMASAQRKEACGMLGVKYHSVLMRSGRVLNEAVFFSGLGDPEVYPRNDGNHYVTGFPDPPRVVKEIPGEVEVREEMCSRLVKTMQQVSSEMAEAEVTTKQSCYLPFTRDSVPCMGKAPKHDNVYVATGHGCWGILLSLASGKAMSELIEPHCSRTCRSTRSWLLFGCHFELPETAFGSRRLDRCVRSSWDLLRSWLRCRRLSRNAVMSAWAVLLNKKARRRQIEDVSNHSMWRCHADIASQENPRNPKSCDSL